MLKTTLFAVGLLSTNIALATLGDESNSTEGLMPRSSCNLDLTDVGAGVSPTTMPKTPSPPDPSITFGALIKDSSPRAGNDIDVSDKAVQSNVELVTPRGIAKKRAAELLAKAAEEAGDAAVLQPDTDKEV